MAVRVPLRVIEFLESPKRVRNWSRVVSSAALIVKSWSSSGPSTDRWTCAGLSFSVSPGFLNLKTWVAPVPSGSPAMGPSKVSLVWLPCGKRIDKERLKFS